MVSIINLIIKSMLIVIFEGMDGLCNQSCQTAECTKHPERGENWQEFT